MSDADRWDCAAPDVPEKVNELERSSGRPVSSAVLTAIDCLCGVAPHTDGQADATDLAPKKSAHRNPPGTLCRSGRKRNRHIAGGDNSKRCKGDPAVVIIAEAGLQHVAAVGINAKKLSRSLRVGHFRSYWGPGPQLKVFSVGILNARLIPSLVALQQPAKL